MRIELIDTLKKAGGHYWEKGNAHRVYFDANAAGKAFDINDSDVLALKRKGNIKTYYSADTDAFYSENGMIVRNSIRAKYPDEIVKKI